AVIVSFRSAMRAIMGVRSTDEGLKQGESAANVVGPMIGRSSTIVARPPTFYPSSRNGPFALRRVFWALDIRHHRQVAGLCRDRRDAAPRDPGRRRLHPAARLFRARETIEPRPNGPRPS